MNVSPSWQPDIPSTQSDIKPSQRSKQGKPIFGSPRKIQKFIETYGDNLDTRSLRYIRAAIINRKIHPISNSATPPSLKGKIINIANKIINIFSAIKNLGKTDQQLYAIIENKLTDKLIVKEISNRLARFFKLDISSKLIMYKAFQDTLDDLNKGRSINNPVSNAKTPLNARIDLNNIMISETKKKLMDKSDELIEALQILRIDPRDRIETQDAKKSIHETKLGELLEIIQTLLIEKHADQLSKKLNELNISSVASDWKEFYIFDSDSPELKIAKKQIVFPDFAPLALKNLKKKN